MNYLPSDAELNQCYKEANGELGKAGPLTTERIFKAMRAAITKWGTQPPIDCTCSGKDAPFGTCCKVRNAFEEWYDNQHDGRLQPFDVFKGGWKACREAQIQKDTP